MAKDFLRQLEQSIPSHSLPPGNREMEQDWVWSLIVMILIKAHGGDLTVESPPILWTK